MPPKLLRGVLPLTNHRFLCLTSSSQALIVPLCGAHTRGRPRYAEAEAGLSSILTTKWSLPMHQMLNSIVRSRNWAALLHAARSAITQRAWSSGRRAPCPAVSPCDLHSDLLIPPRSSRSANWLASFFWRKPIICDGAFIWTD